MKNTKQMIGPHWRLLWLASLCLFLFAAGVAVAQTDSDDDAPIVYVDDDGNAVEAIEPAPARQYTAEELSTLVAPIALYPDDLLAIVLPAATYPLQIVQAARFLDELEKDSTLKPDLSWDESVVALLNYPEAVRLLNDDLDWTWELGEAFLAQQADVIEAVAEFRNLAYDAGNLKSDEYQVVERNGSTIEIAPANPEVIYVPYYEPSRVVVYQSYPAYYYYPRPYPVYYYPYPNGYSFGAGYFWGLTTAYVIGWNNFYLNTYYYDYPRHPYYGRRYYNSYRYYHPPRHRPYYTNRPAYAGGSRWAPGPRYGNRPGYHGGKRSHGNRNGGNGGYDNDGRDRGGDRYGGGRNDGMRPDRDGDGRSAGGGNRGGGGRNVGDGRKPGRGGPGQNDGADRGGNRGDGNGNANNGNGNGNRGRGGNANPANNGSGQDSRPNRQPRYANDNERGDRDGNHRRMVEPEVVSVRNAGRNNRNTQQENRNRVDRTALADQIGQVSNRNRGAGSNGRTANRAVSNGRQNARDNTHTRNAEPEVVSVRNAGNAGQRNRQTRRNQPDVESTRVALNESSRRQSGSARGRSSGRNARNGNQQRQSEPVAAARPGNRSVQRSQSSRPTTTNRNSGPRQVPSRMSEPRQAAPRQQSQPRPAQTQPAQRQQSGRSAPSRDASASRGQKPQSSRPQRSSNQGSSRRGRGGGRREN